MNLSGGGQEAGKFDDALKQILKNYEKIKSIIMPTLGKERQETYSPFLPICPITDHMQVNITSKKVIFMFLKEN